MKNSELRECVGFFAGVIKSGEAWSDVCEQKYRSALSADPRWPPAAAWDRWYGSIPEDIKRKLSIHDLKRIGDCFKEAMLEEP